MVTRTALGTPDPDEDPISYNADAVKAQEHNGASYHLKHLRSAPMTEQGFTSGQGRLFQTAVPRSEERYGQVPQTFTETPNGETLQYADEASDGPTSDAYALSMRVQPPPHPVFFGRDRTASGAGQEPTNPAPGSSGRTIYGGPHRTDQRY